MSDQIIVVKSGGFDFEFESNELNQLEVIDANPKHFTILNDTSSLKGQVQRKKSSQKNYKVEFEGETFEVQIKTALDQRLDSMGLNAPKLTLLKEIKAPMPGLVIEINVIDGQELASGDKILILEAMKMENVLKIPHEGKVKKILVKKGQAVEKGQTLIELE